jgi:hypothetical protein
MKKRTFLKGNHGGQFAPAQGGQFESATHGQFKSAEGGQFDRSLHISGINGILGILGKRQEKAIKN